MVTAGRGRWWDAHRMHIRTPAVIAGVLGSPTGPPPGGPVREVMLHTLYYSPDPVSSSNE